MSTTHVVPTKAVLLLLVVVLVSMSRSAGCNEEDTVRPLSDQEIKRKATVEKMDRANLRLRNTAITEQSTEMLRLPSFVKLSGEYTTAKTPPIVDFVVVPVEPYFFAKPVNENGPNGLWSVWGQGTYYPGTGKFYGSVGNHIYYDANVRIVEYDPTTRTASVSPNINTVLGRRITDFGDGKIHGYLDFYGDDTLYFCTYWCHYPEPTEAQYQSGYDGGKLLSYNVRTGEFKDIATPLRRASWPYHRLDRKRGLMHAVGAQNEYVCYDVRERRLLWGGFPPEGIMWHDRALLLDEETGCAYSSNRSRSDPRVHIIKFDPARNKFSRLKCSIPKNAATDAIDQMRAFTRCRSKDGWFICCTAGGELFRFWPDEERVEDLGLCWPGDPKHLYTTSMALSPDEKYVYYVPGAHGQGQHEGTPVIQLNTRTLERKALAFLFPYFYDKYGYIVSGTFSLDIDEKGETLYMLFNGAFNEHNPEGGDVFGDPAVVVLHIPESERQ